MGVLCQGKTCIRPPPDIDTALHLQQHQTVSGTWDLAIHKTHVVNGAHLLFAACESGRVQLLGCAVDCYCPSLLMINLSFKLCALLL